MHSWSRVAGAACVALEEVPAGGVVVPTDDDDWFSPRLASALAAGLDDTRVGYHWPSRYLEVPIDLRHRLGRLRRVLFPSTPPQWICTTNNYAVLLRPETVPLVTSHRTASRWFVAHPEAVKAMAEPLSIMNRTLASRTTLALRSPVSRSGLLRKHRRYERLYRRALAPELSWCEPYVASMRALMEELHRKP